MRLILGGINDDYLRNLIEGASAVVEGVRVTESVWAAVAYATDAKDSGSLIRWCFDNDIPLKFWGRLDEEVPVRVEILNLFLHRRSPQFVCKLVTHHHAKVIWWRGFGVYVGSANLTYSAWNSNVEAGCFFEESEIDSQFEGDLHRLFAELDANASVLTEELRDLMIARAKALDAKKVPASDFWKHPSIKQWSGLVHTTPRKADDRRKAAFLAEWHSTLQILRDIGATVSLDANRPVWVNAVASPGAQADQFLHAHYYHRTFDGRKADYERHYAQNHANPIKARNEAIAWWQGLPSAPTNEDVAINTTAQRLQELLSENALKRMTLPQFREVAGDVHAMIEFSRRVRNSIVGLQSSGIAYTIPQKLDVLTAHIWNSKAENGSSVTGVITHILYGGPDDLLPERLWEAVADPKWKLECMGISAYGELVGWAMPDKFPPRNGRTSKALRSLGYDVQVHVS
ncbi:phospholipase D-like domain-containing protein [Sphingobium baderi]|uniref:Phospholipase D-like domain-containing protein n=1 Tax=Sphingobium baderi LL03 TaxID=1114964 RepID=T0GBQ8_9SPHN|nr:phospholipase D-like domain-containing protein [Sphingobium baderi]EQA97462.1 hypothetical protein L485_21600 [Sphingobium baderi LL03]KMS63869.1 phospholipase [Sphingobium baderi LL03]